MIQQVFFKFAFDLVGMGWRRNLLLHIGTLCVARLVGLNHRETARSGGQFVAAARAAFEGGELRLKE